MDWLDLLAVQEISRVFSNTTVQMDQSLVINQSLVVFLSFFLFFNGVKHGNKRGQFLALEAFEQLVVITSCSEISRKCEKRLPNFTVKELLRVLTVGTS